MARWQIRRTPFKGQIIIIYPDDDQATMEYEVKIDDEGQPSWKEYYFNGVLYSKTK